MKTFSDPKDLISPEYKKQITNLHQLNASWGKRGYTHLEKIEAFATELKAVTALDYGCGKGKFKDAVHASGSSLTVLEYDPGIPGKDWLPPPVDLVVCTDVLEHIEPDKLDAVLKHLHDSAFKGAFIIVSTRPAKATLPDGRNAHLIIKPSEFWAAKLTSVGFDIISTEIETVREDVTFYCKVTK